MVLIFQLKLYWTLILDSNSTSEGEEKFCCNAPVDLVMCGLRDVTAEYTLSLSNLTKLPVVFWWLFSLPSRKSRNSMSLFVFSIAQV